MTYEMAFDLWADDGPLLYASCADPESFVRGGPILTAFFLVGEGRMDPKYH